MGLFSSIGDFVGDAVGGVGDLIGGAADAIGVGNIFSGVGSVANGALQAIGPKNIVGAGLGYGLGGLGSALGGFGSAQQALGSLGSGDYGIGADYSLGSGTTQGLFAGYDPSAGYGFNSGTVAGFNPGNFDISGGIGSSLGDYAGLGGLANYIPDLMSGGSPYGSPGGSPSYGSPSYGWPSAGQDMSWANILMSLLSGAYGLNQASNLRDLARQAIPGSSPWVTSGGMGVAGTELQRIIKGDLSNDPGFKLAQLGAARTSAQQPGGFAASAAANAALKYQMDRIQALSGPAGAGFNPAAGYQSAQQGMQSAADIDRQALGNINFGVAGAGGTPPWLQGYLINNGMGG